jgi:hypothetical protein
MKKIIIIFLCSYSLQAQNFDFGVKIGVNSSSMWAAPIEENSSYIGFHIGFVSDYRLSSKASIKAELLFINHGGITLIGESNIGDAEKKLVMNSINLPLLFNYKLNETFSLNVGPQIGYLINAEDQYKGAKDQYTGNLPPPDEIDVTDNFKKLTYSLNSGININLYKKLSTDIRYVFCFSRIDNNEYSSPYTSYTFGGYDNTGILQLSLVQKF